MLVELWLAKINNGKLKKIIRPLEFDKVRNTYISTEYDGTIVIKCNDKKVKQIYISNYELCSNKKRVPLIYDHALEVWYDPGDKYNERYPIGINQCGTFYFEAENEDKIIINRSKDVEITSNLLTKEEFRQMVDEIEEIIHGFSGLPNHAGPASKVKKENHKLDEANRILKNIKELNEFLLIINKAPQGDLIRTKSKVQKNKIKKFDGKFLIEREIYPFKDKFNVLVNTPTYDIPEHRMIHGVLENCRINAMRYRKLLNQRKTEVEDRIDKLSRYQKSQNTNTNIDDYEMKKTSASLSNDLKQLNEFKSIYERHIDVLDHIQQEIEQSFELPFLQVKSQELTLTNLFIFSPLYKEVFTYLEELSNIEVVKKSETVIKALKKSPYLYEIWCLISMINSLIDDCGFTFCVNPFENIKDYIAKNNTLKGICFKFYRPVYRQTYKGNNKNEKSILNLEVYYEKSFKSKDADKRFRPDYTLVFKDNGKKTITYLDAKYKSLDNRNDWLKIIKEVAFEKYYQPLLNKPIASFIMYPNYVSNLSLNNWNAAHSNLEQFRHRFGGFDYKPSNKKNFKKWINMIVHYHLDYDRVCLHCGTHLPALCEEKSWKKYFTCKNQECRAFWVKTRCFNRKEGTLAKNDAHNNESATLYKYTKHSEMNYHTETNHEWDVHCPVCNKVAQDRDE
jgi:hypothetical protein